MRPRLRAHVPRHEQSRRHTGSQRPVTDRRMVPVLAHKSRTGPSRLLAVGLLGIVSVLGLTTACLPPPTPVTKPFPTDAYLRSYFVSRPGVEAVAAFDANSGVTYAYGPATRFHTASTIKVAILGTLLVRAQDAKRPLTAGERNLGARMIEFSDNAAAGGAGRRSRCGCRHAAARLLTNADDVAAGRTHSADPQPRHVGRGPCPRCARCASNGSETSGSFSCITPRAATTTHPATLGAYCAASTATTPAG